MKTIHMVRRVSILASLALLAACQTPAQVASPRSPVEIYVADTQAQHGWTVKNLPTATLYFQPQPALTSTDIANVTAGSDKDGQGLLGLTLNAAGQQKIIDATTRNPNKRLALVIDNTIMAAPEYSQAVSSSELVFGVGTEQNAIAAAKAIVQLSTSQPTQAVSSTVNSGNTGAHRNRQNSDALIYFGSQLMQQGQPRPINNHNYIIDGQMRSCTTVAGTTTCN